VSEQWREHETVAGFPVPGRSRLAPLWAAGVAPEGKNEETAPSEAVGCILTPGREGKLEILGKIRPSQSPFFTHGELIAGPFPSDASTATMAGPQRACFPVEKHLSFTWGM
jgi:hypothetical protein